MYCSYFTNYGLFRGEQQQFNPVHTQEMPGYVPGTPGDDPVFFPGYWGGSWYGRPPWYGPGPGPWFGPGYGPWYGAGYPWYGPGAYPWYGPGFVPFGADDTDKSK